LGLQLSIVSEFRTNQLRRKGAEPPFSEAQNPWRGDLPDLRLFWRSMIFWIRGSFLIVD
jgi:hypothetical protein